jgi:hypothetical protein
MIELTPEVILIAKAKRFADKAHGAQMYGKFPYTYHLGGVASLVAGRMKGDPMASTYIAVAWLHDVLEDTTVTFDELSKEFGVAIAYSVLKLTKHEEIGYDHYLTDIIGHPIAREVKICDTLFNLTESFKDGNTKGILKYPRQLDILVQGVYYERDF